MKPSIFNFNEHGVRIVLDENKEPWFCYVDVYKSLGISRTSRLFRELDAKGVADYHTPTSGGIQKLKFINEPNLYRIIFRSNKLTKTTKHAKRHFWLNDICTCHGLLPSHSA